MNKKFSLGITISLVAIACAITFVLTVTISLNMFNEKIAGVTEREEVYTKLEEIDSYVRNNSLYRIDETNLKQSIIKGYISGLNDAEALYMTADEYYVRQQTESGMIISSGIEAEKEESGYLKVTTIYGDSPAAGADIIVGDIITSIEGKSVLDMGADVALKQLQGEENTKLTMQLQRSGEAIDVSIIRKSFSIMSVSGVEIKGFGYIRITAFNSLTGTQFTQMLESLQSQNITSFIIDLRGCTGNYNSVNEIIDCFIGEADIANIQYVDGSLKKQFSTGAGDEISAPLTILVDENTKGPSELVAMCLRDYAGAMLVGKQTAGIMTWTEIKNFSDGSAMILTTGKISLDTSESYDSIGLKPDFAVDISGDIESSPDNIENTTDAQLKKAFEVIESLK